MKMPDLATNEGVELGITRWLANVGDAVKRGQALLEIETDKAVQEVECIANGTLQTIHVQSGEKVPVGTVIATIKVS
ncbi:MAG TPA: biotin/lipoyl-containing protein [Steroidobacter sp.]|uniref:biotin/lipoyl-containing protein n=1 Tax=Peristeroidobacter soli TaxID=2497877 RepID=UPI0013006645|nr:biotin/lipoyl-containing protein [Peristeroidobacter soli]